MVKVRINPLNDFIFLKTLGEKGDEEQLCALINAILGREGKDAIVSVEIIENKKITAEVIGGKTIILDVRAVTAAGERIIIEVQLRNLGNMEKRSLFYWSLEFSRGIGARQDYQESPKVIAINIVNYEFIPEVPEFHLSFHIREDTHREVVLTDALEIHFIDMVKFRRHKGKDIKKQPVAPVANLAGRVKPGSAGRGGNQDGYSDTEGGREAGVCDAGRGSASCVSNEENGPI
jgi:predicted transposase/invertase (TIGR01784 family)